ncbi:MAG TPA: site-specific integrase [Gaiellaceae bacterium]
MPGETAWVEKTFRTKQEAQDWLTSQQAAIMQGEWIDPRKAERPFHELATAWQESWPNRLSPTTAARYRSILDVYLLPTFGQTPIGRMTHEVVQRYVNRLSAPGKDGESGMTPGTVRNVYSVLRNAMNKGVRLGMVRTNPCTNIDLPRSPREEMLFLTPEEVRAVAEAIDPYYRVLVYTAAYTGLRAGELLALRRCDVDLLRGVIHVRRALKDVDGRLEFGPTKTHTQRQVSLPAFLRDMLRDHLTQPLAGDDADALVFPSKTGLPLRHNLFYRRHFKRAVTGNPERGIPPALPATKHGLRFHDLRHTCAALSVAAGAHVKLISARLGHSSVQITLDRYAHLFPSVEEALAEQLDALYRATPQAEASNVRQIAR